MPGTRPGGPPPPPSPPSPPSPPPVPTVIVLVAADEDATEPDASSPSSSNGAGRVRTLLQAETVSARRSAAVERERSIRPPTMHRARRGSTPERAAGPHTS